MPSSGTEFTTASLIVFIFLGVIRGTFCTALYFAVKSFTSPSLVFLLQTPGSVALFVIMLVAWSYRSDEMKRLFLANFKDIRSYWKMAIMGLLQLAAPYMLFMSALKGLYPTVAGVFYVVATPWVTVLLERLPFIRVRTSLDCLKISALCIGFIGVVLVSGANVDFSIHDCHVDMAKLNNDSNLPIGNKGNEDEIKSCKPFTVSDAFIALLCLFGGCMSWSISSVFWRSYKGDVHYATSGVLNSMFGGLYGAVVLAFNPFSISTNEVDWYNRDAVSAIIFLSVIFGWLETVMVDYMYKAVGPAATNRVVCLVPAVTWVEDWLFVRRSLKTHEDFSFSFVVEAIGVVLIFVGLVLSSIEYGTIRNPLQQPLLDSSTYETEPARDRSQDVDDRGVLSEEEVLNSSSRGSEHGYRFPPLVEYKPEISS